MTKPDFEKMARDKFGEEWSKVMLRAFSRFAKNAYAAGRADERERCAKIADGFLLDPLTSSCNPLGVVDRVIAAIRRGGEE